MFLDWSCTTEKLDMGQRLRYQTFHGCSDMGLVLESYQFSEWLDECNRFVFEEI